MAKTCAVCHQTYADHLESCPHCAKERAEDSSVIRLHDPGQTADWSDSPSSSSDERRADVITIDPIEESSGSSTEDSSIEILPGPPAGRPEKKKTHLAPKGRETKLVGKPTDEADIGQEPAKPGVRATPKTMIAPSGKEGTGSTDDSSMEIGMEEKKSGSSIEMGKEKKPGSSFEISLGSKSDSSLEIGNREKPGSSTEIGREKKSGSSLEMALEKKSGSSVEIALDKESGSSMEIDLPKRQDDTGPSSSLLLGGPGSDIGSGRPSSDQMTIGEEARGDDSSAVDLGSPAAVRIDEAGEAMTSDSAVVAEAPSGVAVTPNKRVWPTKKGGAGLGLLIGGGAGVLIASLLWIFGPLDGLRGSLRETVGLSTEKKTQMPGSLHQVAVQFPQAQPEDESPKADPSREPAETKNVPAPVKEEEKKKETEEKKPAPKPMSEPAEKRPEMPPTPATTVEKPVADKNVDLLAQVAPAVKLAKERKYQEAATVLQKVRKEVPATDETFLRCCDELLASWQLLDKLGSAGYPAKQGDALSALDSLLKEKKDASTAMATALEKIKSTDPKAGNLTQAIDSLLEAAKKADEQLKAAQAGLKNVEKEKEEAQVALTATANVLKAGNYLDAQSPNPPGADATRLAMEKLLADKKNSDAQIRQANARLKEAEDMIQDMTQKLVDAKALKPGEKPVRTTRAPSQDADLTLAERYYSSGVAHYWSGDYATAEKDLATAVRYFKDDARFFYYFGLTCWQEGKREQANEAFQKGNELEAMSRPSSAQINSTLERIQGAARQAIDQTREHPQ